MCVFTVHVKHFLEKSIHNKFKIITLDQLALRSVEAGPGHKRLYCYISVAHPNYLLHSPDLHYILATG